MLLSDSVLSLFLALSLGIIVAEIITGRPDGLLSSVTNYPNQKVPSLFMGFGHSNIEHAYHIHHWIWSLPISIIMLWIGQLEIAAFFGGTCLQGLTYGDRFHIKVGEKPE